MAGTSTGRRKSRPYSVRGIPPYLPPLASRAKGLGLPASCTRRVLARDDLLAATAGRDAESYDRSIDMLIMRLRRKIEPDPAQPIYISTLRGVGYLFEPAVQKFY